MLIPGTQSPLQSEPAAPSIRKKPTTETHTKNLVFIIHSLPQTEASFHCKQHCMRLLHTANS